jgi:predicted metal-binding transcription factor (methanogenesis marker protein 9)
MSIVRLLLLPIAFGLLGTCALATEPVPGVATEPAPSDRIKEERAMGFARDTLALAEAKLNRLAAIQQRIATLRMEELASAVTLASPSAIKAGKRTLAQFRALEAEKLSVERNFESGVRRLLTPEVVTGMGPARLDELNVNLETMKHKQAQLAAARESAADAVETLLTWASKQKKPLQLRDGKLVMATDVQAAEFEKLVGRFIEAAKSESPLVFDANRDATQSAKKAEEAKEILSPRSLDK